MEAFYQHDKDIGVFSATYTVPEPPKATVNNVLYYWIGLQDVNSSANPVIQPVLSYVPGASRNNWYFASWNCCPAGHKLEATQVSVSGPGESLTGVMQRDKTTGTYTITSRNAKGDASVLLSDDSNSGLVRHWNWVDIVLEVYDVKECQQYSSGGEASFLNMRLVDIDGHELLPSSHSFSMSPYIDGRYLPPAEAAKYTACCSGNFALNWPNAGMTQN